MSMPGNPERESIHQLQKQPVHQLQKQRVPKAGNRPTEKISDCCYRCGKQGHKQFECLFKDVKCFGCCKIAHAKAVCRTVRKTAQKNKIEVEVHRKSAMRRLSRLVAIFTCYTKEKRSL